MVYHYRYIEAKLLATLLHIAFFRSEYGREPVREWLKELPRNERKVIGEELKTVQFGWPLGMPVVRKMDPGLWEVRVRLDNRIARVFFTVEQDIMVLLHGFIKKGQKTPQNEIETARRRLALIQGK